MAVWINIGHVAEDGGSPWKHLRGDCSLLRRRASAGHAATKVNNPDARLPLDQHNYRRCPECFGEGGRLAVEQTPRWLERAAALQRASRPGTFWTYVLSDPESRHVQVGMAANLGQRLRSRWRATLAGRFDMSDSIPWLYDRVAADPRYEPEFEAAEYASREEALAHERALRTQLRHEGWHDSSDV